MAVDFEVAVEPRVERFLRSFDFAGCAVSLKTHGRRARGGVRHKEVDVAEEVGGFSEPSKMPWLSWSTPAKRCQVGSRLREVEGSTCSGYVAEFLRQGGVIPRNLCVRLSAHMKDGPPPTRSGLPVSTVHTERGVCAQARECPAYRQGGRCVDYRACWDKNVQHVSYPVH